VTRIASGTRRRRARGTPRAAIIGAGPGGLAAAMLLAKAGMRVSVHERLNRLGGRSGTLVAPGPPGMAPFRFDIGPTFSFILAFSKTSSPPVAAAWRRKSI